MNNARFFPELRPDVYPDLVSKVTAFARSTEIRVFDGKDYVNKIKLADQMHFAVESTEAIVMMYCDAIKAMRQSSTQRPSTDSKKAKKSALPKCGKKASMTNHHNARNWIYKILILRIHSDWPDTKNSNLIPKWFVVSWKLLLNAGHSYTSR